MCKPAPISAQRRGRNRDRRQWQTATLGPTLAACARGAVGLSGNRFVRAVPVGECDLEAPVTCRAARGGKRRERTRGLTRVGRRLLLLLRGRPSLLRAPASSSLALLAVLDLASSSFATLLLLAVLLGRHRSSAPCHEPLIRVTLYADFHTGRAAVG